MLGVSLNRRVPIVSWTGYHSRFYVFDMKVQSSTVNLNYHSLLLASGYGTDVRKLT
jgi:hypothetical protein